jgi:hypothetical protein
LNIPGIIFLLIFLYFSYFYWLKYPNILSRILVVRDKRIEKVFNKIWSTNLSAKGFAIHKMMKRPQNRSLVTAKYPDLIVGYDKAKRYWYISLIPIAVLFVYGQIMQGHEMLTDLEGFREKIDNAWFNRWFREFFGNGN